MLKLYAIVMATIIIGEDMIMQNLLDHIKYNDWEFHNTQVS